MPPLETIYYPHCVDAQHIAVEHPDTFSAPSLDQIIHLKIGDVVKICDFSERFWVKIKGIYASSDNPFEWSMFATIDNHLMGNQEYNMNDSIGFQAKNIYSIWGSHNLDNLILNEESDIEYSYSESDHESDLESEHDLEQDESDSCYSEGTIQIVI